MPLLQKLKKKLNRSSSRLQNGKYYIPVTPTRLSTKDEFQYKSAYALYNYTPGREDEISFLIGDIFTVYKEDGNWWLAKNCRTGQKGLIPPNYVTMNEKEATILNGWYDVDRTGAENKLLVPGVEVGMFIIRPGKSTSLLVGNDFPYALSIRGEGTDIVHFRVGYHQQSNSFYLTPKLTFPSMNDLLNHYKSTTIDGKLGLTEPRPPRINPPLNLNDCKYDLNKLEFLEVLGSGNFGVVYKAKIGNVLMAVKRSKGKQGREAFLQEVKTMLVLKHPSIVQFLGIAEDSADNSIIIMIEFMANGSLNSYFKRLGAKQFTYIDLITMIDTLVQGMVYLESLNVIHMDLRADNALVNEAGKVKIADFGLTQILGSGMNTGISQFPVRWTAPEIMCGQATYTTKCDVWSFGVLMFEILTCGMLPYGNLTMQEVKDSVPKGLRLPSPTKYGFECDATIYSIMQSCWNVDPQKRPMFKEIYIKTQKTIINATKFYSNAVSTDKD